MPRFEKTPLHAASAVLILLALYALAGFGYALCVGSRDSAVIWAVIGVLAIIASVVHQRFVRIRRERAAKSTLDHLMGSGPP